MQAAVGQPAAAFFVWRFQPGTYVYERTRSAIWHCAEHTEPLIPPQSAAAEAC